MDANGIAGTWACAFGLWSLPPAFIVGMILAAARMASMNELPYVVLRGACCVGPFAMMCSFLLFAIAGHLLGLLYGHTMIGR
jgi:hypothetical protein